MGEINIWQFLAGLGLFLFAMKQLEQALAAIGSNRFRGILRRHTHSPLRAIVSGTLATTIVQSSSLVGLFTLALAGAGMLELRNAIGIILGSNLGTTATGWLVATLGFKLPLSSLSLPLIAGGSLAMSLLAGDKPGWKILLSAGLLLFGLGYMKDSLESMQGHLDIETITTLNPLLMFAIGALFTAIIQSSSGAMVITLGALNANLIELPQAAALVIGADLGTTSTLLLGGLPGSQLQRQIACAHFCFNLVTDVLALVSLPLLLWLVTTIYQLQHHPLLSLVAIHSSFNLVGILLFLPVIEPFARFLQRLFPKGDDFPLQVIPATASDIAVEALERANRQLVLTVLDLNRHSFKIREETPIDHFPDVYDNLKIRELDMLLLAQKLQQVGMDQPLTQRSAHAVQCSREAMIAAKEVKDIREDLIKLRHHDQAAVVALNDAMQQYQKQLYQKLQTIITRPGSESAREQLQDINSANKAQHESFHRSVLPLVNDSTLQALCPTLLNINREVYLSNVALTGACQESMSKIMPKPMPA